MINNIKAFSLICTCEATIWYMSSINESDLYWLIWIDRKNLYQFCDEDVYYTFEKCHLTSNRHFLIVVTLSGILGTHRDNVMSYKEVES
jgi:hypothetical protein